MKKLSNTEAELKNDVAYIWKSVQSNLQVTCSVTETDKSFK